MLKRARRAIVAIAVFTCSLSASIVMGDGPETADKSPAKIAQQVYDGLLEEYQSGKSGGAVQLDLLNNWSERILMAEFGKAVLGGGEAKAEVVQKSIRDHLTRMKKLERLVASKHKAGSASSTDLLAARYFRLEGNGIEQLIKSMQQLLQPVEVEGDFDIKMPDVGRAKPLASKPPAIVIAIDAEGKFSVKGKELTFDELQKLLKKFADDNRKSATAQIRAHPECLYGTVVRVLDACNKAGLSPTFTIAETPDRD